jgi:hypothetical protein
MRDHGCVRSRTQPALDGGEVVGRAHKEALRRALNQVSPTIGLHKCRVALPEAFEWRHVIGI